MRTDQVTVNRERSVRVASGWVLLPILILLLLASLALVVGTIVVSARTQQVPNWWTLFGGILLLATTVVLLTGFFTLQPNEARVLVLFGEYRGTVRVSGFHWANPFYGAGPAIPVKGTDGTTASRPGQPGIPLRMRTRNKISLRARNMLVDKLKVNDKRGNPIEIAAVVVWRVEDTAQAMLDVDDYETYVRIQSESALRHVASLYAYDHGEEAEITLRSGVDEVCRALQEELTERLGKAGVAVYEARLTHLAYAPEIAQAMLRRQQAEAVIAARQKIVHGAVSMVEMALRELAEKQVVQLDDERRAAMVSNLMVVLCAESEVHPVINAGTLYN
jgi:regulator of protease activity HflC (stomatin/prohibitin superfamily)